MAVFLINICKFNGCGIVFPTLRELIQHIEDTHIDFDPQALERQEIQQPSCVPTSCILRVFTDGNRRTGTELGKKRQRAHSPASSICSSTPNGSEMDEEEVLSASEDSNDSWASKGEFKSEFLLRLMGASGKPEDSFNFRTPASKKRAKTPSANSRNKNGAKKDNKMDKKDGTYFKCTYRELGQSHLPTNRCNTMPRDKTFICPCGRSYKTSKGLKNHSITHHGSTPLKPPTAFNSTTSEKSESVASTVLSSFLKAQKMQNYTANLTTEKQHVENILGDQHGHPPETEEENNHHVASAMPSGITSTATPIKLEHSALLEELKAPTGLPAQANKMHNQNNQGLPNVSTESAMTNGNNTPVLSVASSPKSLPLSSPTLHQHLLSPLTKLKSSAGGALSSMLEGDSYSTSEDQKCI